MLIVNKLDKSGKPLNKLAKNGNSINKIYRNGEVVFQNVTVIKVTAITLDNLVWTTNIPWSGGTATKDNCTYSVTAYYSDGTTVDVTSEATITGSQVIPSTNIGEVHSAGTLTLTASYSGFTATGNVTVYQEAYMAEIPYNTIKYVSNSNNIVSPSAGTIFNSSYTALNVVSNTVTYNSETGLYDGIIEFNDDIYHICKSFCNKTNLVYMQIPNSVIYLGNTTITDSARSASGYTFSGCTNMTGLTSSNNLVSIGSCIFEGNTNFSSLDYDGYTGTTHMGLPSTLQTIGHYCFLSTSITGLTIGDSVNGGSLINISMCMFQDTQINEIYNYTPNAATKVYMWSDFPFYHVKTNGVLHYPINSDYSYWLRNKNYWLGKYNWTGIGDL